MVPKCHNWSSGNIYVKGINRFLDVFGGMPREVWGGAIGFSIPTGLKLSAQGREERATLGENRQKSQPCKGCICFVN
ncbi:MAG: hypothetical protein ABSG78_23445, partial [Verrucomicrobiota bacterium]